MTEQEIESRILICEIKERDYLEVGNTKTAERYSQEKYKWERLLSKLDPKRDKELSDYKRGYVILEQALNKIKDYCNENIQICKNEQPTDEWECCIEELQGILQIIDKALGDEK